MRFAKLEIKIILALFLTRYDFSLVDSSNKPVEVLPKPYRDNL
jgi:sterol 14-demethylase